MPPPSLLLEVQMGYIYTVGYNLATRKMEIIPFTVTWMDLEIIILSKGNQTKTNIIWYHSHVASKK